MPNPNDPIFVPMTLGDACAWFNRLDPKAGMFKKPAYDAGNPLWKAEHAREARLAKQIDMAVMRATGDDRGVVGFEEQQAELAAKRKKRAAKANVAKVDLAKNGLPRHRRAVKKLLKAAGRSR